jgi:nitrite reductase/ring-hydroxylating ferredoxin subunit
MSAVAVCKLSEIESGKVRKFTVDGRAIAVVRIDDAVYAIGDRCSHADVSLSDGDVMALLGSPVSIALWVMTLGALLWPLLSRRKTA